MSLHLLEILLEMATLWSGSMHTGSLRVTSAYPSWADLTTPTVVAVPTDSMSGSLLLMPSTCMSAAEPTTLSSSVIFILNAETTGGMEPGLPTTLPVSPSDLVIDGSSSVPMAMSPPGRT